MLAVGAVPPRASSPASLPAGMRLGGQPASHQGSLDRELPRQVYANDTTPRGNLILEKVKCCKDLLSMATVKMSTRAPSALTLLTLACAKCASLNQSPTS